MSGGRSQMLLADTVCFLFLTRRIPPLPVLCIAQGPCGAFCTGGQSPFPATFTLTTSCASERGVRVMHSLKLSESVSDSYLWKKCKVNPQKGTYDH